jgi:hypothetical protein
MSLLRSSAGIQKCTQAYKNDRCGRHGKHSGQA